MAKDYTVISKDTNMAELLAGDVMLPGTLPANTQGNSSIPNAPGNYSVVFDIKPEAVTGSHAGTGTFNVVFTGTQHTTPPTP